MNKLQFIIGYVFLSAVIAYMPIYYHLAVWIEVGLPIGVIVLEQLLNQLQIYISLYFARKKLVIFAVSGITFFISLCVIVYWLISNPLINAGIIIPAFQFIMQGAIVGVIIRQLLLSISLNNLFGRSFRIQRLFLLLGIAFMLWLFPINIDHGPFSGFYIFGIASGLIAHFLWRRVLLNRLQISRYGRGILVMINGNKNRLNENEKQAFRLFINNRWKKLEKLFDTLENDNELEPRLKILKACMHRVKGNYTKAIHLIDNELARPDREVEFDNLLYLQKGLAHSELDDRVQMYESLEKSSMLSPDNFLLKATLALRLAEEIPLEKISSTSQNLKPLELIREAMLQYAQENNSEILSNLIKGSVAFRWGFAQDVYGYALLKAGDFIFSKDLLLSCIEKEPAFSSSYLHLGEWYIAYYLNKKKSRQNLSLARRCFSIALKLEKNANSRIAKRARLFIKEYKMEAPDETDDTD